MDGNVKSKILKSTYVKELKPYTRQEVEKFFDGKSEDEFIKIIKLWLKN